MSTFRDNLGIPEQTDFCCSTTASRVDCAMLTFVTPKAGPRAGVFSPIRAVFRAVAPLIPAFSGNQDAIWPCRAKSRRLTRKRFASAKRVKSCAVFFASPL